MMTYPVFEYTVSEFVKQEHTTQNLRGGGGLNREGGLFKSVHFKGAY